MYDAKMQDMFLIFFKYIMSKICPDIELNIMHLFFIYFLIKV